MNRRICIISLLIIGAESDPSLLSILLFLLISLTLLFRWSFYHGFILSFNILFFFLFLVSLNFFLIFLRLFLHTTCIFLVNSLPYWVFFFHLYHLHFLYKFVVFPINFFLSSFHIFLWFFEIIWLITTRLSEMISFCFELQIPLINSYFFHKFIWVCLSGTSILLEISIIVFYWFHHMCIAKKWKFKKEIENVGSRVNYLLSKFYYLIIK